MPESTASVVLASGGLDSTTIIYMLRREGRAVYPLFIDYGQHCADIELATLRSVVPREMVEQISIVNIADVYRGTQSRLISEANLWIEAVEAEDLYLPYRNLLLLSVASAFAQSRKIPNVCAGFINSNHAKELDCSADFFDRMHGFLSDYGSVSVQMPLRNFSKVDVVKLALTLDVPIGLTYSCQISSTMPCGACPNCVERLAAIAQASSESA